MLNLWHLATFRMNVLLKQSLYYSLWIKDSANEQGEQGTKGPSIFMMHA